LKLPEVRERFAEMGIEPSPLSVQEFDAHIRSEAVKWAKAIKDSGATAEQ
jgi:tripartite-type tricarboxylate transporter receptor subunit TctC